MNSVLEQIYATILPSAPYVIAAYAIIWFVLLAYVVIIMVKLRTTVARIAVLEEMYASRQSDATESILKS